MNFRPYRLNIAIALLVIFTVSSGLVMTPIEKNFATKPNITNLENGLWWAVSTVTSVGYGDYYPTSTLGKIIGAILEVSGVSIFGVIVALITIDMFRREQQYYWTRTTDRFNRLEEKLDSIEKKQSYTIRKP
jgi:voltage-gated potassium channel